MALPLSMPASLPLRFSARLVARIRALLLAAGLVSCAGAVHADIYGFIDEHGMGHFSTEKLDERYELFAKGDQSFDSGDLASEAARRKKDAAPQTPMARFLVQHPRLKQYDALLNQTAKDFAIEPALLKAVIAAESGFNPAAVSPKGAIGLMQIMPATAERFGLRADKQRSIERKLADPKINIRLGARYLRELMRLFPDRLDLVLASYNAGEGAVRKYRNSVPPYPETRNYVQVVNHFYELYKPAETLASSKDEIPRRMTMILPGRRNMPESSGQ